MGAWSSSEPAASGLDELAQGQWKELPEAAEKLGKPYDFELDPDSAAALEYLATWRNLMHTAPDCRDKLHAALVDRGAIDAGDDESVIVALLSADLAEWATTEFEKLFRWAQDRTGIDAPFTKGAWMGEGFRRLSSAATQVGVGGGAERGGGWPSEVASPLGLT